MRLPSRRSAFSFLGLTTLTASLFSFMGCGLGDPATQTSTADAVGSPIVGGILHGGPNPVIGATVTLYTTTSTGYGVAATKVTTATTGAGGNFQFVLPTDRVACPSGEFAYVGAYSGSTGAFGNNTASLLMVPVGACDSLYSSSVSGGVYTNTYLGSSLWIDELTTAVSAYALSGFMTVSDGGVIDISAPANNHNATSVSVTAPAAAGLNHAFATALAIINNHTGHPNAYTNGGTSKLTGGVIPVAEIYLLGNILQACVNSNGLSGANTSTANDGSPCGKLFSYVTPPQTGAAVPANTLQAMLDLAKYPTPQVNTWNSNCTAAGGGSTTATTCIFNLAAPSGAYTGALSSPPPDWTLAVVYTAGYGAQTSSCATTCPGLAYPYHIALDSSDNVYVLNWGNSTPNYVNIVGVTNSGSPIFASAQDTTNTATRYIATDTAGHVISANHVSSSPLVSIYSASTGAVVSTITSNAAGPLAILADPFNNVYLSSTTPGVNVRRLNYSGPASAPVYSLSNVTGFTPQPIAQLGWDSNLDLYMFGMDPSSAQVYFLGNSNSVTTSRPILPSTPTSTVAVTGDATNVYGLGVSSTGSAFVIDSVGVTNIAKTGNGTSATIAVAGSPTTLPTIVNNTPYNHFISVDGRNWVYSVDNANGGLSGVSVYDSVDNLGLGPYLGCYVVNAACGTGATTSPMFSARGAALDSSGNIWVVSGASGTLTELIGAAAPTWPALSMAKFGRPQ